MNDIQTTAGLREDFIQYFRNNDHKFLKPSKCFTDDPTVFFTTAGMLQLKPIFLGLKEFDPKFSKLANSQICIRCGGKHNDLDDVGLDSYHLTSFDMLGSWSLNAYWKEESIALAFNYLVKCGLDPNRMYATYFEGNDKIEADIESREIWKKYLDESHIIAGSTKDNFWSLGSGPCGPCTEIHYDIDKDRRLNEYKILWDNKDASSQEIREIIDKIQDGTATPINVAHLVNKDDPTVIEIWNIVLMQYNEIITPEETKYDLLNKTYCDTGMGLQRLAMVLQNKTSIYQTDVFRKLIKYVEILSADQSYTDKYGSEDNGKDKAFRIFADHIRTVTVALYDGARFDCNGRGFILRKVVRRMLINFYMYLNNYVVVPILSHPIIEALIAEVLNFHMFYKHDTKELKKLMVEEETMFIGRLNKFKMLYSSKLKKRTKEEIIAEFILNADKLKESHGVDKEVIDCIDRLTVVDK